MIYIFFYKITCILTGLAIIFLGYQLFLKNMFTNSGDIQGIWKDVKVTIRKAAPGTYFVLFGSIIIGVTIHRGFDYDEIFKNVQSDYPSPNKNPDSFWDLKKEHIFYDSAVTNAKEK